MGGGGGGKKSISLPTPEAGKIEAGSTWASYQCEDVLVGSPCEDPRLVAEVQAPAQQPPPVGVAVVVVVDDAGEAQRHVAEKGGVLHHVGVGWEGGREEGGRRDDKSNSNSTEVI